MLGRVRKAKFNSRVEELVFDLSLATKDLCLAIEAENAVLESAQLDKLEAVVDGKSMALSNYISLQEELANYAYEDSLNQVARESIEELMQEISKVDELAKKNDDLIMLSMEVNAKVVDIIREKRIQTEISNSGYNSRGKMNLEKTDVRAAPAKRNMNDKV